jgi:hypothetical protein
MAFKSAFVVMAPDGDPKRHRATIKTPKLELTSVVIELLDFDQAVEVCRELVQKEGVQALNLCPGFTHQAVARIASSIGRRVPISVARGDVSSTILLNEIVTKEGWFLEE